MPKYIFAIAPVIFLLSCNGDSKTTVVAKEAQAISVSKENTASAIYTIDTTNSTLQWEGYEGLALGKSEHNGTINISEGTISVAGKELVSGKFLIDINTLKVADIPTSSPGNAKLVRHLLGADFFDAAKFPEAIFEITKAASNGTDSINITGNLTLKGISKSIAVPAAVKVSEGFFTATTPKFYINRKDWGMHYRSENSFGDEMIRNEIGIIINLTAKK